MIRSLKSEVQYHLGLKEARPGSIKLKLRDFVDPKSLAAVPATFGHENLISSTGWGMLGNDTVGDCVIAGACHETMLFTLEGKAASPATFTDAEAIQTYSAITGYTPKDPSSDQGTDMDVAAKYRRQTGITDAKGNVHQVAAYLDLTPGDLQEFLYSAYYFGAVGIGIRFPGFAMDQFNAGKPWDVSKTNAKIEGGHYIPLVASRTTLEIVTWGRVQGMTTAFFKKYCDQGVAYLSQEIMSGGKTPEGLDLPALQAAFTQVTTQ